MKNDRHRDGQPITVCIAILTDRAYVATRAYLECQYSRPDDISMVLEKKMSGNLRYLELKLTGAKAGDYITIQPLVNHVAYEELTLQVEYNGPHIFTLQDQLVFGTNNNILKAFPVLDGVVEFTTSVYSYAGVSMRASSFMWNLAPNPLRNAKITQSSSNWDELTLSGSISPFGNDVTDLKLTVFILNDKYEKSIPTNRSYTIDNIVIDKTGWNTTSSAPISFQGFFYMEVRVTGTAFNQTGTLQSEPVSFGSSASRIRLGVDPLNTLKNEFDKVNFFCGAYNPGGTLHEVNENSIAYKATGPLFTVRNNYRANLTFGVNTTESVLPNLFKNDTYTGHILVNVPSQTEVKGGSYKPPNAEGYTVTMKTKIPIQYMLVTHSAFQDSTTHFKNIVHTRDTQKYEHVWQPLRVVNRRQRLAPPNPNFNAACSTDWVHTGIYRRPDAVTLTFRNADINNTNFSILLMLPDNTALAELNPSFSLQPGGSNTILTNTKIVAGFSDIQVTTGVVDSVNVVNVKCFFLTHQFVYNPMYTIKAVYKQKYFECVPDLSLNSGTTSMLASVIFEPEIGTLVNLVKQVPARTAVDTPIPNVNRIELILSNIFNAKSGDTLKTANIKIGSLVLYSKTTGVDVPATYTVNPTTLTSGSHTVTVEMSTTSYTTIISKTIDVTIAPMWVLPTIQASSTFDEITKKHVVSVVATKNMPSQQGDFTPNGSQTWSSVQKNNVTTFTTSFDPNVTAVNLDFGYLKNTTPNTTQMTATTSVFVRGKPFVESHHSGIYTVNLNGYQLSGISLYTSDNGKHEVQVVDPYRGEVDDADWFHVNVGNVTFSDRNLTMFMVETGGGTLVKRNGVVGSPTMLVLPVLSTWTVQNSILNIVSDNTSTTRSYLRVMGNLIVDIIIPAASLSTFTSIKFNQFGDLKASKTCVGQYTITLGGTIHTWFVCTPEVTSGTTTFSHILTQRPSTTWIPGFQ
jgi:hypothetical protein